MHKSDKSLENYKNAPNMTKFDVYPFQNCTFNGTLTEIQLGFDAQIPYTRQYKTRLV